MIEQCVRVTRIAGGRASIESLRDPRDCSRCHEHGTCRNAWVWRWSSRRPPELVVDDEALQVGDELVVRAEERALLRGLWLLYGVPLCGLLAGTLAGSWLADHAQASWPSIALALSGLALGAGLGRFLQSRARLSLQWRQRSPAVP